MLAIITSFISKYMSNIYVWAIGILLLIVLTQTVRLRLQGAENSVLKGKLEVQAIELASHHTEFVKMQELAKNQEVKLQEAYKENAAIQKAHAKNIERILTENTLPENAGCEDVAKWARDIAKRRGK